MKSFRWKLKLLITAGVLNWVSASPAYAQATRTWVSGVGDDVNPCSRTAPCKTFAGAISKTAAGGSINCLDPGGYGGVTITKAMTIDCGGMFGSALVGSTNAIIVNANASSDVITLRNIDIQGSPPGLIGINYLSARALNVQNVTMSDFTTSCIDVNTSSPARLSVQDVTMTECGTNGISANANGGNTVAGEIWRSRIANTTNGINAKNGSRLMMHDVSVFATSVAVNQTALVANASVVLVVGSTFSLNGTALQSIATGSIFSSLNNFYSNSLVFNPNGGGIATGNDNNQAINGAIGVANGGVFAKM